MSRTKISTLNLRIDKNFKIGNGLFRKLWVSPPSSTVSSDGLGPLFNARSCQRCHLKDGRGHPPEGNADATSMFLRLARPAETDAEREAAAALLRFPGERDLLFVRAAALERLDRFDEAEEAFLELLALRPDDVNAANYLGYLWADRNVRLDEALALVHQAVTAEPENPAFLDSLGWVYYRLGSMDEAEFWLRRAIELNDGDGTLFAHLGEVLLARGEIDEASRYLRLALDLGCESPEHVQSLLDGLRDGAPR